MKRRFSAVIMAVTAAMAVVGPAPGCGARGANDLAEVRIIDRDSGAELPPHWYRGERWVAGTPGARYAIEIRNRLGERLLAVASVDGVNAVSGATAGWDQVGYVLGSGQRYQITGWRKSDAEVAAFTFANAADSYAARTGRPANVGIIGIALFRERQPLPSLAEESVARDRASSAPADASNPGMGESKGLAAAPKLGTGHGAREYSHVGQTEFERLQAEPNELVRIHYDSLERLVSMGIVRRPRPLPVTIDPFPATPAPGYAPDPPA
jgi:hypothetical protein